MCGRPGRGDSEAGSDRAAGGSRSPPVQPRGPAPPLGPPHCAVGAAGSGRQPPGVRSPGSPRGGDLWSGLPFRTGCRAEGRGLVQARGARVPAAGGTGPSSLGVSAQLPGSLRSSWALGGLPAGRANYWAGCHYSRRRDRADVGTVTSPHCPFPPCSQGSGALPKPGGEREPHIQGSRDGARPVGRARGPWWGRQGAGGRRRGRAVTPPRPLGCGRPGPPPPAGSGSLPWFLFNLGRGRRGGGRNVCGPPLPPHVTASLPAYGSPGDTPVGGRERRLVGVSRHLRGAG